MSRARRALVVVAGGLGLSVGVSVLSAFQGGSGGLFDAIGKLGPNVLMLVLGAMGVTWIRKQERTPAGSDVAAGLQAVAAELRGLAGKFSDFLLDQAREDGPRRRAVEQVDSMSGQVLRMAVTVDTMDEKLDLLKADMPNETAAAVMEDLHGILANIAEKKSA